MANSQSLPPLPLPEGISEDYVDCTLTCGLTFHIIEANKDNNLPLVLLIHGYPEVAFSWRKVMPSLAANGFHVVAVDQRGYGRTTGWDTRPFDQKDMNTFRLTQLVMDMVALVNALGYSHVHTLVGHDFGAVTSAICALCRPDFFRSLVLMSHPFNGSPKVPFGVGRASEGSKPSPPQAEDMQTALTQLSPPRKHYKWYNSTAAAVQGWDNPAQGLTEFLRGYIHLKSAKNSVNKPHPLKAWTASELAKMPGYYIMPLELTMPETIAEDMEGQDVGASKAFISDEELAVYVGEWSRTGFGGALTWYRSITNSAYNRDLLAFAGKKIECPSVFISGAADWGNCQEPGALEGFDKTCSDFRGVKMIEGAGHWPQQEQPEQVVEDILSFIKSL